MGGNCNPDDGRGNAGPVYELIHRTPPGTPKPRRSVLSYPVIGRRRSRHPPARRALGINRIAAGYQAVLESSPAAVRQTMGRGEPFQRLDQILPTVGVIGRQVLHEVVAKTATGDEKAFVAAA